MKHRNELMRREIFYQKTIKILESEVDSLKKQMAE
jgi:hypothetical protein